MKFQAGGADLELRGSAWFLNFQGTPIFHAWESAGRTRCGRMVFRDLREVGTPIPPRLAVKIGRPCCVCWPVLLNRPSLFSRRPRARHEQPQEVLL